MKLKVIALSLLLAVSLGACAKQWAGDPQLVHQLKVNMAAAEVKKLFGEPSNTTSMEVMGIVTETWIYNGKQKVILIVQNGKLKMADLDGKKILEATVSEM